MGLINSIKVRIVAKELKGMLNKLNNAKKWAVLVSIFGSGLALVLGGLGVPGGDFLLEVLKHAHLTPSETGAPINMDQITLLAAGGLQVYTVIHKLVADWKKAKVKKDAN